MEDIGLYDAGAKLLLGRAGFDGWRLGRGGGGGWTLGATGVGDDSVAFVLDNALGRGGGGGGGMVESQRKMRDVRYS